MRKLFILSLLAMIIAWGISGCGGGGTSADPLGTDSISSFGDTSGSAVSQVNPNGAVSLKTTVKNAAGTAVVGREVSFGFVSNVSGATLASSSAKTNGAGEATILYMAGATAGSDVVRASISNGAKMDVSITVGSPTGAGEWQIALDGAPTSLAAGQISVLTATVVNAKGDPVSGQRVTFDFLTDNTGTVIGNKSGAIKPAIIYDITDSQGKAVAVYTAVSVVPAGTTVEDIVQATVGTIGVDGSTNFVTITVSP